LCCGVAAAAETLKGPLASYRAGSDRARSVEWCWNRPMGEWTGRISGSIGTAHGVFSCPCSELFLKIKYSLLFETESLHVFEFEHFQITI
jgi:hypothetical protein